MDQIIKEMGIDNKSMIADKYRTNSNTNMLNKRKSLNTAGKKDINLNEKDKNYGDIQFKNYNYANEADDFSHNSNSNKMSMSMQGGFGLNRMNSENRNYNSKFSNSQFNESGNESKGFNKSFNTVNKENKMQNSTQLGRNLNKNIVNNNNKVVTNNITNLGDDDIFDEYLNVRTDDIFMNKMYTDFQDNQRSIMVNNHKNERDNKYNINTDF